MSFDATGKQLRGRHPARPAAEHDLRLQRHLPRPDDQRRVRQARAWCGSSNHLDENPLNLDRQDFGAPDCSFLTHLHNGHTAPESDGNPHYSMSYGPQHTGYRTGQWVDNLYLNWPAGGDDREKQSFFWFHDHRMDHTGSNVYKGMVGLYPIYDPKPMGDKGGIDMGDERQGLRLPGRSHRPRATARSTSSTTSRWRSSTAGSTTASRCTRTSTTAWASSRPRSNPSDAPGVVGQDVLQALPEPRLRRRHLHRQRHRLPGAGGQAAQVPVPLPRRLGRPHLRLQADELDAGPEDRRVARLQRRRARRGSTASPTASSA